MLLQPYGRKSIAVALAQAAPIGAADVGEADDLSQRHPAFEPIGLSIPQPIEQFLLALIEAAVAVPPPEQRHGLNRTHHLRVTGSVSPHLLQKPDQPGRHLKIGALLRPVLPLPDPDLLI